MDLVLGLLKGNIDTLVNGVLGLSIVWAVVAKGLPVLKEISELLAVVVAALADKKITNEEMEEIIKQAKDIPGAIKKAK